LDCSKDHRKRAIYALEVISDFLGINISTAERYDQNSIDIYYGPVDSTYKNFPLFIPFNQTGKESEPQLTYYQDIPLLNFSPIPNTFSKISDSEIPFDLITAVYYLLSDSGERGCPRDIYDRPIDYKTLLGRMNILDKPVVNIYCALLKKKLIEIGKKKEAFLPLWPQHKSYAVALSHDVDLPEKYISSWKLLRTWRGDLRPKILLAACTVIKNNIMQLFRKTPDPYWNFNKWVQLEGERGFCSTFFFASAHIFSPKSSVYDPLYSIEGKKYSHIMHLLREKGWSIGLHASYDCWKDYKNYKEQKQDLEKINGEKIIGLRNHYYHLNPENPEETLDYQRKAGFVYDSSLTFNDAIGFRRGIAFPYNPYNLINKNAIDILEIPTTLGDEALFLKKPSPQEALNNAIRHLQEVKKYNGLAVLNWHCRSLDHRDYPYWGEVYTAILDYLKEENEAWITSLDNIALWWKKRRQLIKSDAI
jgi:peptidoglycan/xylan/chitin deacetylase (PgdA/CDA1 family)